MDHVRRPFRETTPSPSFHSTNDSAHLFSPSDALVLPSQLPTTNLFSPLRGELSAGILAASLPSLKPIGTILKASVRSKFSSFSKNSSALSQDKRHRNSASLGYVKAASNADRRRTPNDDAEESHVQLSELSRSDESQVDTARSRNESRAGKDSHTNTCVSVELMEKGEFDDSVDPKDKDLV